MPVEWIGLRLDAVLARLFPQHSRSRLASWLKAGWVRCNGRLLNARDKLYGGEILEIEPPVLPDAAPPQAEAIALNCVYEDDEILVIDKPAGLVVHPGNGNFSGTLLNALLHHAPQLAALPRAGIVHRLDKDTSGLLVVAKTLVAQTDLVRQLQARTVSRRYLAIAGGVVMSDGVVDAPIRRHPTQRTRMAVTHLPEAGRAARTHYFVREHFKRATLLECRLETGRTHQIRVHLASIGHALLGDAVYGHDRSFQRQALHAWRLGLIHPSSHAEMAWEAPPPADFAALLERLRDEQDTD